MSVRGYMNSFKLQNYFTYKDEVSRSISWGHWFLFLNIFLALAIGCCYFFDASKPSTGLGVTYLVISWLGHFSCLVFIFYLIIFFPLAFIGSLKNYRFISIILSILLFSILLIDVKLYQAIKIHLNTSVLDLFFEQEGFSTGLNFNFLYIAVPTLVGIEIFFSHLAWKHIYLRNHQGVTYIVSAIFLVSFFSTHFLNIWANAYRYSPITIQKSIFPAYYPMTANTFLAEHGWIIDKKDEKQASKLDEENFSQKIRYPLESIKVIPKEKPFNLIIIMLNGINQKYVNTTYMPHLTNFSIDHDMYMNNFLGSSDSNITNFELAFGIPGQYQSLMQSERYAPVFITEMLHQDYKIKAFVSGISSKKVQDETIITGIRKNQVKAFSTDVDTLKAATHWIENWTDRPQMTLISLNNIENLRQDHIQQKKFEPQLTLEDLQNSVFNIDTEKLMNRYFNCIYSLDSKIGSLLEELKEKKFLDNTVVIITSAKGFSFPNNIASDRFDRENNHVPLIISWPDAILPSKILALSSSQDIAPTISKEILGIQNAVESYSTGINLREIYNRPWILSGSEDEIHIIDVNQTTIFDKHGNANIYSDDKTETNQTNMATLIKAMKLLNKFKEK